MEQDLFYFFKNSLTRNLCEDYKKEWKLCKSDKEKLINLAMRQQSIPYFATAMYEGWGLSVDYLVKEFGDYMNGKCLLHDCDEVKGYSYSIYADYSGYIILDADVCHIIRSEATIGVDEFKAPIIYLSNGSDVDIQNDGSNSIIVYMFDESKVRFPYIDEHTTVTVFKYSENAQVTFDECDGKLRVHKKQLKL